MPEVAGGQTVRLLDYSSRLLDKYLTKDQQSQTYLRPRGVEESVARGVKFYIPFVAKQTGQLINLGRGIFRLPTDQDIEDAAEDADIADVVDDTGVDDELDGWIYAFSFPTIQQKDKPFPIKVGKTAGDVETRVSNQCKQSATFENPIILGRWKVKRVGPMELAVHNVLKARGKWRENVPGTEWFDTTVSEIEDIIAFVTATARKMGA